MGVFLLLLAALGFALAKYSMSIRRQTLEGARAWQEDHYDLSWYDALEKEDYTVTAEDGYVIHAQHLVNPGAAGRMVIISHGYTDNRFGALKYAKMYLNLGFEVIVYDLRGHGANEPTFCTYSIRESRDLDLLIRDARKRYPACRLLGIQGESLGSATSVAVLKYHPDIRFVVADCGFSEIASVMRAGLRSMHLPGVLVHAASLCARIRYGYSYRQMRPIDSLADNQVPILFIHGEKDDFILPAHSRRMAEATRGYQEVRLIPGAGHAASILTDPAAYKAYVTGFLKKIGVLSDD